MTRYVDFYKKGFQLSLEVYPPKTAVGINSLIKALKELQSIAPAYVSVTYGAMGTTQELTKDLAFRVYDEIKAHTAFHFTCVGMGKEQIKNYVDTLYEKGIKLVLALRGDIPKGENEFIPAKDGFYHANELVSYLKSLHDFSIAVAGYPEKHPEALTLDDDIDNLKRKVDAGADAVITQLFFDNHVYYDWLNKVRQKGIVVPVVPGIMPINKLSQIKRITELCGASLPKELLVKLEACEDEKAMREVGIDHAIKQCQDLINHDVPGIHFYCLNQAYSVIKVAQALIVS